MGHAGAIFSPRRQQLVKPVRGVPLHVRGDMRIRIHRERDRRLSKHLRHDLRMLPVREPQRGGGVSEVAGRIIRTRHSDRLT